jgi:hypothetical protein
LSGVFSFAKTEKSFYRAGTETRPYCGPLTWNRHKVIEGFADITVLVFYEIGVVGEFALMLVLVLRFQLLPGGFRITPLRR